MDSLFTHIVAAAIGAAGMFILIVLNIVRIGK